jgi:hypothetical protein
MAGCFWFINRYKIVPFVSAEYLSGENSKPNISSGFMVFQSFINIKKTQTVFQFLPGNIKMAIRRFVPVLFPLDHHQNFKRI